MPQSDTSVYCHRWQLYCNMFCYFKVLNVGIGKFIKSSMIKFIWLLRKYILYQISGPFASDHKLRGAVVSSIFDKCCTFCKHQVSKKGVSVAYAIYLVNSLMAFVFYLIYIRPYKYCVLIVC